MDFRSGCEGSFKGGERKFVCAPTKENVSGEIERKAVKSLACGCIRMECVLFQMNMKESEYSYPSMLKYHS